MEQEFDPSSYNIDPSKSKKSNTEVLKNNHEAIVPEEE